MEHPPGGSIWSDKTQISLTEKDIDTIEAALFCFIGQCAYIQQEGTELYPGAVQDNIDSAQAALRKFLKL